jgi:hypothetical protein
MPSADARMMLDMHMAWHARRHPPDPELAKEQALRVNTKTATKLQMDPELAKEQALRVNAKKATKLQMDPELAKEQALRVNAKKATKMQTELELERTALCTRCLYEAPELVWELPRWLLELHALAAQAQSAPAHSPHTCTPLTDSVKLPAVPSIPAEDCCSTSLCQRRSGSSPLRRQPPSRPPVT